MDNEESIAIEARGLTKRFGAVEAVAGIDFTVRSGELFGFLGPNGAGKTTTINMFTGLARPDSGNIRIGGVDCTANPRAAQNLIGVVPDESNLYPELTGFENLCFCASLYGMRKAERSARASGLLKDFGLEKASARKFGGYSKGMKRKLTIAAGIIHRPSILFLDEPTTGIDIASARQVRQLVSDLHRRGTTIFLTTHYIEEAERLCERIAFIVNGRIRRIDTVAALLQPLMEKKRAHIVCSSVPEDVRSALAAEFPEIAFTYPEEGRIQAESAGPVRIGAMVRRLEECAVEVFEARRATPSLEDVFVRITGIEAGEMAGEREKNGGGKRE
jgi:ABC-2 type transport system ATP-binding protein